MHEEIRDGQTNSLWGISGGGSDSLIEQPWPGAADAIRAHAVEMAPNESCGFVMNDGSFQPCRNIAPEPEKSFSIHHEDVRAFLDDAVAYVHSECYAAEEIDKADGVDTPGLSSEDMQHQWAMGIPLGVVKVLDGFPSGPFWYGDTLPPVPLIGRPFVNGIWDCYSAIRDVYRWDGFGVIAKHFGEEPIILPDYPRDYEW